MKVAQALFYSVMILHNVIVPLLSGKFCSRCMINFGLVQYRKRKNKYAVKFYRLKGFPPTFCVAGISSWGSGTTPVHGKGCLFRLPPTIVSLWHQSTVISLDWLNTFRIYFCTNSSLVHWSV